jgi:glutamine cyclotransferase
MVSIKAHFALICALVFAAGCSSQSTPGKKILVPTITPKIIRILPHDTAAFTQGFLFMGGKLYESTGLVGQSSLRIIDAGSGALERNLPVADIFCEGLAAIGKFLVQLTWKNGFALIYELPALQAKGKFLYEGEGWGLTSRDSGFIMSNGTDTLYFRDNGFAVRKRIAVTCDGRRVTNLNELEYARGCVYANVWYSDVIYAIDPSSGKAKTIINCSELVTRAGIQSPDAVLNGIAYDPTTDHFYLTGKNWPAIFEVTM